MTCDERPLWVFIALGLGLAAGSPSVAQAGNGLHPRTEVLWDGAQCMTVVDRSVNPVVHVEYGIPFEDTEVTPDEVADSRRHQFLAFCEPHHPQAPLPNWVSQADVAAAVAQDLIMSVDPDDILDGHPQWGSCFSRINADADRRPITFAMANQGVDWDTTGLPAGAYNVNGYTWEPAFNLYSLRPGVFKITDGTDPGPAAAITTTEQILERDGSTLIEGCIDAAPGTTLTAFWADADDGQTPNWIPFATDQPVDGPTFAVQLDAPEELIGGSGMVRIDFNDPSGQSYTAYMSELVIVLGLGGGDDGGCATGGGFVVGGCSESGGDTTTGGDAGTTTGGGGTTTAGQTDDGGGKGGCRVDPTTVPLWALWLGPLALRRRRQPWH